MTPEGRRRLERFIARFEALATENNLDQWVHTKLIGAPVESRTIWEIWKAEQQVSLKTVFSFITHFPESGLEWEAGQADPLFDFFRNVEKYLQLPDQFDQFFNEDPDTEAAYHKLHPDLITQVSIEFSKALDELLIGADSSMDFFNEKDKKGLHVVIDRTIEKANEYSNFRELAVAAHEVHRMADGAYSAGSYSDRAHQSAQHWANVSLALNVNSRPIDYNNVMVASLLQKAAEISETSAEYHRTRKFSVGSLESAFSLQIHHRRNTIIEGDDEVEELRVETVMRMPKVQLTSRVYKDLFKDPKSTLAVPVNGPTWMNISLALSGALLLQINTYLLTVETELREALESSNTNNEKMWRNILDFYTAIVELEEASQLTASAYYKESKKFPKNIPTQFFDKTATVLFSTLLEDLKEALMEVVKSKAGLDETGYRLTTHNLERDLKFLQQKYRSVPKGVEFKSLRENDVARWQLEKRAGVDYLVSKNDEGKLHPRDFPYLNKTYPCFAYTRFFWTGSDAGRLRDRVEKNVRELIWTDAGGNGPDLQLELRTSQRVRPG